MSVMQNKYCAAHPFPQKQKMSLGLLCASGRILHQIEVSLIFTNFDYYFQYSSCGAQYGPEVRSTIRQQDRDQLNHYKTSSRTQEASLPLYQHPWLPGIDEWLSDDQQDMCDLKSYCRLHLQDSQPPKHCIILFGSQFTW